MDRQRGFLGTNLSDSESSIASTSSGQLKEYTLRVWCGRAVTAPGSQYKSVVINTGTTADEVVGMALSKFGEEQSNKHNFRLAFVTEAPQKKSTFGLFKARPHAHILEPDESPALVAEWFTDAPRKFELVKASKVGATQMSRAMSDSYA